MAKAKIKVFHWMRSGVDQLREVGVSKAEKPAPNTKELENLRLPLDVTTYNIVIEHYCKEDRYEDAMRMLGAMDAMGRGGQLRRRRQTT